MHPVSRRALMVSAGLATTAFAFSMPGGPAQAQQIDQVVIAGGTDVVGLNGIDVVVLLPDRSFVDHISDTLTRWEVTGKLVPFAAKSVTNIDPVTWEVVLREGIKFHNGEMLDAEAIKFSFEMVMDPKNKSPSAPNTNYVERIEVIDPLRARIITKTPNPIVPNLLANLHMMPRRYIAEVGVDGYRRRPVGTGAYRFVEHIRDERLVLEAFPDYWGGPRRVRRIVYRPIKEDAARVAALLTGEIDIALRVPPELAPSIRQNPNLKAQTVRSVRSFALTFSNVDPSFPTNNVKVREAISYGIDREALNQSILVGTGAPTAWFNPLTFGANPDLKPIPYDPERSKRLLAEAGYPNGLSITLDTPSGQYVKDREMAQAIAGQLSKVGINVRVEAHEWGVFLRRVFSHNTNPIVLVAWGDAIGDPAAHNSLLLHSKGTWSKTRNPEIDKVLDDIAREMDPAKRAQLIRLEQDLIRQHHPLAYLVQMGDIYGTSRKVDWWEPRGDEKVWLFQSKAP
jgi:peptide/nickel transport system substrate-binding protein